MGKVAYEAWGTCRSVSSINFGGQLVGWTSLGIPGFEMEYHDILLIRLVSDGLMTDCIEELLLSESLYSGAFLEQEVALAVAEISRREQADAVDVPFSPFWSSSA